MSPAAVIESKPIWESAAVAIAGGVGIVALFSLGLLGTIRYAEARREERPIVATLFGALAITGLGAAAVTVIAGLIAVA